MRDKIKKQNVSNNKLKLDEQKIDRFSKVFDRYSDFIKNKDFNNKNNKLINPNINLYSFKNNIQ